jgi:hypothetical protein
MEAQVLHTMNSPASSLEQAPITKDTKPTNIGIPYSMTSLATIAMASNQNSTRSMATTILRFVLTLALESTWYRNFSFLVVFHRTVYILYCADSNLCLVTNPVMLLTVPTE